MTSISSMALCAVLTLTESSYCYGYISNIAPPGFAELLMGHRGHNNLHTSHIAYPGHAHMPRYYMPPPSVADARGNAMDHRTVPHMQNQPEPRLNGNDLPQVQYTLREAETSKEREKEPLKPALKRAAQNLRENTMRKSVHWTDEIAPCLDLERYRRRFIRQCPPRQIMTVPFTVAFEIGGERYTVLFEPLAATTGLVNNFENELERYVPDSQKPLLRLAMSRGYALHFHRLLRTSTTKVDAHDPSLREGSFNCFLNAVFQQANVTLEWL
jgi:hypothetical protein